MPDQSAGACQARRIAPRTGAPSAKGRSRPTGRCSIPSKSQGPKLWLNDAAAYTAAGAPECGIEMANGVDASGWTDGELQACNFIDTVGLTRCVRRSSLN